MPKRFSRALCWIRRDLRLEDHVALARATSDAERVAIVFVFDTNILDALQDRNDRRLTFIHSSLCEIDEKLRRHGSKLIVLHGDPTVEIPRLAKELGAEAVYTARDYDPYAIDRDAVVKSQCALVTVKDSVIFEGGEIRSQSGTSFRTYTPYANAWRRRFQAGRDDAEHVADPSAFWPAMERVGFPYIFASGRSASEPAYARPLAMGRKAKSGSPN